MTIIGIDPGKFTGVAIFTKGALTERMKQQTEKTTT